MHLVTLSLISARTKDGVKAAQFNASGHWLYLFNVQKEDLGSYNCIADNGYGTATSLAIVMSKYFISIYSFRVKDIDESYLKLPFWQ